MSDPSYLRKFRRAQKHLDDLDVIVKQFVSSKPYVITEEKDPERLRRVWSITLIREAPEDIAPIAGDAIHNLRSVLDHWVDEFSMADTCKPRGKPGFPIRAEEETWDKASAAGDDGWPSEIRWLPEPVKALIRDYQPFQTKATPHWMDISRRNLLALQLLDIRDKHQTLNVVAASVDTPGFGWYGDRVNPTIRYFLGDVIELDTPRQLLVLDFTRPEDFEIDVQPIPFLDVVLVEKEAHRGPIVGTIESLRGTVNWIVGQMNWVLAHQGSEPPIIPSEPLGE